MNLARQPWVFLFQTPLLMELNAEGDQTGQQRRKREKTQTLKAMEHVVGRLMLIASEGRE